jgi:hypothetical protein
MNLLYDPASDKQHLFQEPIPDSRHVKTQENNSL